jgi:hypothetical protein
VGSFKEKEVSRGHSDKQQMKSWIAGSARLNGDVRSCSFMENNGIVPKFSIELSREALKRYAPRDRS